MKTLKTLTDNGKHTSCMHMPGSHSCLACKKATALV